MKAILLEAVSIIKVILFWAVALPAAALVFPAIAGWQTLESLVSSGPFVGEAKVFGQGLRSAAQ